MDDATLEQIDGIDVEYYKGRFLAGSGHILDRGWALANARVGKLPIFLVAATVTWTPKIDRNGDMFKLVNFHTEEMLPLEGEMKRQAKIFLSQEGEDGVIDFGSDAEGQRLRVAVLEHERLEEYMAQEWAGEVREGESVADRAIRLLEELRGYEAPADLPTEPVVALTPNEDAPVTINEGPEMHDIPDEEAPRKAPPPPAPSEPQPDFSVPPDSERPLTSVPASPEPSVPGGPIFDIPPDHHDGVTFSRPVAVAG